MRPTRCRRARRRRIAVTRRGYIALVPRLARAGDVVALFYGATVPYVAREAAGQQRRYSLMGDAYVHGIMGEVVSTMGPEAQDILLV